MYYSQYRESCWIWPVPRAITYSAFCKSLHMCLQTWAALWGWMGLRCHLKHVRPLHSLPGFHQSNGYRLWAKHIATPFHLSPLFQLNITVSYCWQCIQNSGKKTHHLWERDHSSRLWSSEWSHVREPPPILCSHHPSTPRPPLHTPCWYGTSFTQDKPGPANSQQQRWGSQLGLI